MLSARDYANKYAGKTVGHYIRNNDIKVPIGIVVGFKIGRMGFPGSSKVAVYPYDIYSNEHGKVSYGTEGYTKVWLVDKAIDFVYFFSVNELYLVGNDKERKTTVPYPHICKKCKSPCHNGNGLFICSNAKCSTKKKLFKILNIQKKVGSIIDDFVSCVVCGTYAFSSVSGATGPCVMTCCNRHSTTHRFVDGEKFYYRNPLIMEDKIYIQINNSLVMIKSVNNEFFNKVGLNRFFMKNDEYNNLIKKLK